MVTESLDIIFPWLLSRQHLDRLSSMRAGWKNRHSPSPFWTSPRNALYMLFFVDLQRTEMGFVTLQVQSKSKSESVSISCPQLTLEKKQLKYHLV